MAELVAFSGTCKELITFDELMEIRERDLPKASKLHSKRRSLTPRRGLSNSARTATWRFMHGWKLCCVWLTLAGALRCRYERALPELEITAEVREHSYELARRARLRAFTCPA